MNKNRREEFLAHFSDDGITQEMIDYITEVALVDSRYLFLRREGDGNQYGYCTHCRTEDIYGDRDHYLNHNETSRCNHCNSKVTAKHSGKSRNYLNDHAYVVFYQKSVINPQAITAIGIHVRRNYAGDFSKVETEFRTESLYLFVVGVGGKQLRNWWNRHWHEPSKVISEKYTYELPRFVTNIDSAVKGTPFQYSTWEQYLENEGDMVAFFDLYARYPCIEYLTKLGMRGCVEAKLHGQRTFGAINWRASEITKVLRLPKNQVKEILSSGVEVDLWFLHLFRVSQKDGSNLSIANLAVIQKGITCDWANQLSEFLKRTTLRKLYYFLIKQVRKCRVLEDFEDAFQMYRDYIRDCTKLNLDISDESVLFPPHLHRAHLSMTAQINYESNERIRSQIKARKKELDKYKFEANGFFIRPAIDQLELIEEGRRLKHCVGGYARQYAEGECIILLVRKIDAPDMPYYTIEVRNNKIMQCYGLKHRKATKDVQMFVDAFTAEKLAKKPKKTQDQNERPCGR